MKPHYIRSRKSYLQKLRFLGKAIKHVESIETLDLLIAKFEVLFDQVKNRLSKHSIRKATGLSLVSLSLLLSGNALKAQEFLPAVDDYSFEVDSFDVVIPNLVDIDNDGDLDLLGAHYDYSEQSLVFSFLENLGTQKEAVFGTPELHPFGLEVNSDQLEMLGTFDYESSDIDNDGDFDLVSIGKDYEYNGNAYLNYIENIGTTESPMFGEMKIEDINLDGLLMNLTPTSLTDIDNDGDLDILTIGLNEDLYDTLDSVEYSIGFLENISSDDELIFEPLSLNPFGIDPIPGEDNFEDANVTIEAEDFDNDGDIDILTISNKYFGDGIHETDGPYIHFYENKGNTEFEYPVYLAGLSSLFDDDTYFFPDVNDFDNDGDIDIVLSIYAPEAIDEDVTIPNFLFIENRNTNTNIFELSEIQGQFNIYPNIASDKIKLNYAMNETADLKMYILDTNGRFISSSLIRNTQVGEESINVSDFSKGVYYLKLVSNQHTKTLKFIKL